MPGVDFHRLRSEVTMEQVLSLLGFVPRKRSAAQWYNGTDAVRCPSAAQCRTRPARSFSVNVVLGRYFCHRCRSRGNPIEPWAAATNRSLHQAAIDLCQRLGRDVPWIRRR